MTIASMDAADIDDPLIPITDELIESGKSLNGGWSRNQLWLIGVPWPPQRGWRIEAVKRSIPASRAEEFTALSKVLTRHQKKKLRRKLSCPKALPRPNAKKQRKAKEKRQRRRIEKAQKQSPKTTERRPWVDYHKYIASAAWARLRKLKLKEAGYKCEECPATRPLQVHHLTYEHLGNEELYELQVLCEVCHQKKHPDKPISMASALLNVDPLQIVLDSPVPLPAWMEK